MSTRARGRSAAELKRDASPPAATLGQRSVRRSTLAIGLVFAAVGVATLVAAFALPLARGAADGRTWLCGVAALLFAGIGGACLFSFVRHPATGFTVADEARQRRAHHSISDPRHDR